MRHFKRIVAWLALAGAAVGLWAWGDRVSQELGEWKRVWEGVYAEATGGAPGTGEVSVEGMGRAVLKEIETARKGGAEVKASVEELAAALAAARGRTEKTEAELAELKRTLEERAEASVAELRAKYEAAMEESRAEVALAKEERAEAVKNLAAVQTRLADVEATLEAVINVPGDAVELGEEGVRSEESGVRSEESGVRSEEGKAEEEGEREEEEGELLGEQPAKEAEGEGAGAVEVPEEEPAEEVPEVPEEAVVAGRVVGGSRLFLTLAYEPEGGVLKVQFQDGGELAYRGVPEEVARAVREAGNKVDGVVRRRVKGKYETDGDEAAAWKGMEKWNKKRKGKSERVEAVWVGGE